jgi:glutamine synthetase
MIRFTALQAVQNNTTNFAATEEKKSTILSKYVFTNEKMERYLGKQAYKQYQSDLQMGQPISEDLADQIAAAMRTWAMEHGASHYTHCFQPITGLTA